MGFVGETRADSPGRKLGLLGQSGVSISCIREKKDTKTMLALRFAEVQHECVLSHSDRGEKSNVWGLPPLTRTPKLLGDRF